MEVGHVWPNSHSALTVLHTTGILVSEGPSIFHETVETPADHYLLTYCSYIDGPVYGYLGVQQVCRGSLNQCIRYARGELCQRL